MDKDRIEGTDTIVAGSRPLMGAGRAAGAARDVAKR